jgi:class 3 adenylate cyclase
MTLLTEDKREELKKIAISSLIRAEELWNNTLGSLREAIKSERPAATDIPGHPYLRENDYLSDQFITLMVDMRDSTKHLRQAISAKIAKVSQMQRVYYEVSALLPVTAKIIQDEKGAVTEYLGDGLIALFQIPKTNKEEQRKIIYSSSWAARKSLEVLNEIINPILFNRYGLPPVEIGIGLAFSDAIICRFGHKPNTQIKVIGQCIYFASSLAKEGRNEILIHEDLERIWPTAKIGTIKFVGRRVKDFTGYLLVLNG